MLYLLAAVGAATVAVLLWRAFGAERVGARAGSQVAPDDDPEFLASLNKRPKGEDEPPA